VSKPLNHNAKNVKRSLPALAAQSLSTAEDAEVAGEFATGLPRTVDNKSQRALPCALAAQSLSTAEDAACAGEIAQVILGIRPLTTVSRIIYDFRAIFNQLLKKGTSSELDDTIQSGKKKRWHENVISENKKIVKERIYEP
jgi:hypothetical protein